MNKYILAIAVFICGAVTMIMEIVGSRVLAPFLGTSIVVWTSLIGVILGSLSLGYFWGGRAADRSPSIHVFSVIIFAAGAFIVLIVFIKAPILNLVQSRIDNLCLGALAAIVSLFAAPSILLGMVAPYAIRLKMKNVESSGAVAGNIYAFSTIGSIAGTFAAGFFLIPFLGSTNIFFLLAALLFTTSIIVCSRRIFRIKSAMLFFALAAFSVLAAKPNSLWPRGTVDMDTMYNRLLIVTDMSGVHPTRSLIMDPYGIQSAMYLDSDELVFEYTKFFRLAGYFKPDIGKALLFGGAAYSYPKDFLYRHPGAQMDVVEIDPGMTEVAKKYFNLPDDPRLRIFHEDARTFLNKTANRYDVIFGDAFNSRLSIPYQLTTVGAVEKIYNLLDDGGVAMINLVSAIEGNRGKFLRAEFATYASVFPQVFIFPVAHANDAYRPQNIILVAFKSGKALAMASDDPEHESYLEHLWTGEVAADIPVLTDDYAPVDYYNMNLF
jgi:spermidine synthase